MAIQVKDKVKGNKLRTRTKANDLATKGSKAEEYKVWTKGHE